MGATKQSQAVALANEALSMAGQFAALHDQANSFVTRYNNTTASTTWAAMPTANVNTDGSLAAADGSPNAAHPIDARAVPTMNRAVLSADLVTFVAMIQAFQNFMTNAAVTTANRRPVVDPLVGG